MSLKFANPQEDSAAAVKKLWEEAERRKQATPETLQRFYADPLAFVMWAYRWGQPGTLERFTGPDKWQKEFLTELGEEVRKRNFNGRDPVMPIRMTVSSGNGAGKGTLAGWLVTWLLSTRPFAQGTVTANTFQQLEDKTWATIQHWFRLSRTAKDFLISASGVQNREHRRSWKCTPQTCREENSESFAGQHAANSTSFYIFDEASAIPEKIWEVAEFGLTDGSPMLFAFGNPTRASGKFYRINFGDDSKRWGHRVIDSRDCLMPNKSFIEEQIYDNGEDSDWVRVHIKGLPPTAGDMQFISSTAVFEAQKRPVAILPDEPLIAGVDLARGGADNAVVRFRQGTDARTIPPIKIPGEQVRNSMLLVAKLADLTTQKFNGVKVHTWFVDGTGIGGPIIDRLAQLGHKNFIEIQFGAQCPDLRHYANMRAFMWGKLRDALADKLAIDPKDRQLEIDLTSAELAVRQGKDDRICLEAKESMKKRGLRSPDDGDALALTYARPVAMPTPPPKKPVPLTSHLQGRNRANWMGY